MTWKDFPCLFKIYYFIRLTTLVIILFMSTQKGGGVWAKLLCYPLPKTWSLFDKYFDFDTRIELNFLSPNALTVDRLNKRLKNQFSLFITRILRGWWFESESHLKVLKVFIVRARISFLAQYNIKAQNIVSFLIWVRSRPGRVRPATCLNFALIFLSKALKLRRKDILESALLFY